MADYCTVADVKSYLNITDTQDDAVLGQIVARASAFVDNYTQMPKGWARETLTETLRPVVRLDGNLRLLVGKPNVETVTSFVLGYGPDTADEAIDVSRVWIEGASLVVWDTRFRTLRGTLMRATVTYTGGYNPVPQDIVHSTAVLAARMYKARAAGWSDVVGTDALGNLQFARIMPREVQSILNNYRRVVYV